MTVSSEYYTNLALYARRIYLPKTTLSERKFANSLETNNMHRLLQQDVRRDTLGRDKTNVTAVPIRDCAIITWRGEGG